MEELEGYVENIVFRNEENGYTVLHLSHPEWDDEICCVGCFSYVAEGQYLVVRGERVFHKEYGEQIKMVSYEEKQPEDSMAIEKYLGSGAIKGIGPTLAARIVRKFKEDTFRIFEEEPERLAEVKGISIKLAIQAANQFNEKREMRQAMIFLQDYGISMNLAVKIYRQYGQEMYEVLRTNLINWQRTFPELVLRLPMRLQDRQDFIRILISGFRQELYIVCSSLPLRDIVICPRESWLM